MSSMADATLDAPAAAIPQGDGRRIVVGLSGGVDSSVSAWLLKQRGWDVVGLFMKNWEDDDDDAYCSTRQDLIDAASVADLIGIDIEAVNFAAEYRERVFAEFLREYSAGRTPNPDVLCNAEIKFKAFLDHALRLGAQTIATGHYARIREAGERASQARGSPDAPHEAGAAHEAGARCEAGAARLELLRGVDPGKDQSYFLHRLTQGQLARAMFPLGHLHKREVRAIAARIGLPNARKKDSTGICFIGERPFREFLSRYLPTRPGPIRAEDGRLLGEHVGLAFYTLGQRKGIGLGGTREGSGEPWYVARKDLQTNTLCVVQGRDHRWLMSRSLRAQDAHWVSGAPPAGDARQGAEPLVAKTRYRQSDAGCSIEAGADGRFSLVFDDPQWAVTPGQSAVLYRGEVCLGGGIISEAAA
ncbi:MAG: tRNA 2-thiouridine(34) synthase MnmA [Burkholderiaceae bacterium]|nr:tRNA 2-thiouridine(34) synthase MnmA [Burkholderiaceae bacterium]